MENGFLFKGNRLCISKSGFRELLIQELHGGALAGHFGIEKTCSLLKEHYFWPKMSRDVEHFTKRCSTCQLAKDHIRPQGLYTALLVPQGLWGDVSLDFITGLPRTQRHKDSIIVVVDRFLEMAHFVACQIHLMLHKWLIFVSSRLCIYTASQGLWHLIVIQNS